MKEIRVIKEPVERMCEVKYFIHCYPITPDPHFAPEKDYIFKRNGKTVYFETLKDAKKEVKKHKGEWINMKIYEKVTPIEEENRIKYNWHYETLRQYNIKERDILNIKQSNPSTYKQILTSEWNRWCEDLHLAKDFNKWKEHFNL